jgi:Sec-independent protein secretion pathway component TatC
VKSADVLTLVALSLPMCLLYESCIWIAWFMQRKAASPKAASPEWGQS